MIPTLALQEAVRSVLVNTNGILAHVDPQHIRAGSIRPTQMPAIILTPTTSEILGRASGNQLVAEVKMMVHVWINNDLTDTGVEIASAAAMALVDAPRAASFDIDEWQRPQMVWFDQDLSGGYASHGTISLRATIRWRE